MWESYAVLKSLIQQKDEVINQLYTQMSNSDNDISSVSGFGNGKSAASGSAIKAGLGSQILKEKEAKDSLLFSPEREFAIADAVSNF